MCRTRCLIETDQRSSHSHIQLTCQSPSCLKLQHRNCVSDFLVIRIDSDTAGPKKTDKLLGIMLTCIIVFWLERNCTNRGTTPHSITRSIGGFFSLLNNLFPPHQHRTDPSSPWHVLSELHRRLKLHLLIITVHRLQHIRESILESRSAELHIVIRIDPIVDVSRLEVPALGDGLFSLLFASA